MGTAHTFALPDVGEGLTEAEIVRWLVAVGDIISVNDSLVEIETAKSLVELPSPLAGHIHEILVPPGRTVPVGTPIVVISPIGSPLTEEHNETPSSHPGSAQIEPPASVLVGYGPKQTGTRRKRLRNSPSGRSTTNVDHTSSQRVPLAKPPVRKLAKQLGVKLIDLPPGPDGLINREQVEQAAAFANEPLVTTRQPVASPDPIQEASSSTADKTRMPTKGVQKAMAAAMVASAFTAPHATLWRHVDMTATMELVARLRGDKEWADVRVTPLLILAKAVLLAARRYPIINSTWDDRRQEVVSQESINLGIATATPRGLLVPNLKSADQKNLKELAYVLDDLIAAARDGRTMVEDMKGGTLTITNIGVFGVEGATPILNPGEASIVAFGAIRKMPWVLDDQIIIRPISTLSLTIDHRVIDGERGSLFLADIARFLECPSDALLYIT